MIEFPKKKKKVDYEALSSAFMRIPGVKVETARDLLDLGFKEPFQLIGRSPEALFEELKAKKQEVPADRLQAISHIVTYVEQES